MTTPRSGQRRVRSPQQSSEAKGAGTFDGDSRSGMPEGTAVARLANTLQDAVDLLRAAAYPTAAASLDATDRGNLLQQCLAMCELQQHRAVEPLRTVHHLACTGGTLISKCIAAMPNVQLLSEIDPLSPMLAAPHHAPRFAPTDMGSLLRQSTRGAREDLLIELFRTEMRLLHADASNHGTRLVLRDHSHSHFCYGPSITERPTLPELLPPELPRSGIVTVRDPVASFAALTRNRWLQFSPPTIDEYARRYLAFLDRHAHLPLFRYEDFVARPACVMEAICDALSLPFAPDFEDLYDVFRISGDSGRKTGPIAPRPALAGDDVHREAAANSAVCRELMARLDYDA